MKTKAVLLNLCLFAALVVALPAQAAQNEIFTVRGVPVDATAGEAAEARVIAIRQGRQLALKILLQRLTLREDWPRLPFLASREVTTMGAGYEVSNEKNSPTRYLATVTYHFQPDAVRKVLRGEGISFSEAKARPAIVLPVWVKGEEIVLWEDENAWLFNWAARNYSNELVPLVVPLGDLGDALAAPIHVVQSLNYYEMQPYAERYGVQDILLVAAVQEMEGAPLKIDIVRLTPTGSTGSTFTLPVGREIEKTLALAIDRTVEQLQEDWKSRTIVRLDEVREIEVSAQFANMSEWLKIERAMAATPNIVGKNIKALSTTGAYMTVRVVGNTDQLSLALAQHDIALTAGETRDAEGQDLAAALPRDRGIDNQGEGSMTSAGDFFALIEGAIDSAETMVEPDYWVVRYQEQLSIMSMPDGDLETRDIGIGRGQPIDDEEETASREDANPYDN